MLSHRSVLVKGQNVEDQSQCRNGLSGQIDIWKFFMGGKDVRPSTSWWRPNRNLQCQVKLCEAFLERADTLRNQELMKPIVVLALKGIESYRDCENSLRLIHRADDGMRFYGENPNKYNQQVPYQANVHQPALYFNPHPETLSTNYYDAYPANYQQPPKPYYHQPSNDNRRWNFWPFRGYWGPSAVGAVTSAYSGIRNNGDVRRAADVMGSKGEQFLNEAEKFDYRAAGNTVASVAESGARSASDAYETLIRDPRVRSATGALENKAGHLFDEARNFDYQGAAEHLSENAKNFDYKGAAEHVGEYAKNFGEGAYGKAHEFDYEGVANKLGAGALKGAEVAYGRAHEIDSDDAKGYWNAFGGGDAFGNLLDEIT